MARRPRRRPSSRDRPWKDTDYGTRHQSHAYADYAEQPGIFARLRQAFADHRKFLATYDELNALNDRELADIGLSRLDVRDVAREAIYGN
jgi:uncharacterized protein YjiS (DUF1127 family)